MTVYADEKFYKNEYLCGKKAVVDTAFEFYARSATVKIKDYTGKNIDENNISENIKMCCCEVAEQIYNYEKTENNNGISSESVGGWSKSYESSSNRQRLSDKKIKLIIYKWLSGTGLLYRGVVK